MQYTLYNGWSDNCCAYCELHRCFMTVKQMKCKNCLQKQCWHLVKNQQHPYWHQREVAKEKRRGRKQRMNEYLTSIST